MNYLLIVDGSYYHRWQAELCIESFKYHNLEDNLFLYYGKFNSSSYLKNISNHKNKVFYKSSGDYFYDKLFILKQFSENNKSICLLHPDMLLQNPISLYEENIITSYNPETLKIDKQLIVNEIKDIIKKTDSYPELIPVGDVLIFNQLPEIFFNSLIDNYIKKRIKKTCFLQSILKAYYGYFNNTRYTVKVDALEQTLMHDGINNNFIHYQHGFAPNWSKNHYKNENFSLNNSQNPFDVLYEYNLNSSVNYMLKLVERYLI